MPNTFAFADELGPEKVMEITDPRHALRAIVVIDNTAAGPAIGGCRMAPDVTATECFRLARAMTLKNAAAGLPHGGGKSVIVADPKMAMDEKEELIRAFGRAIREIRSYVVGPDMGTDETAMGWIRDEIGRAVGLPREIGGIPLDEIGATGRGLAAAARALEGMGIVALDGARVAIQGYGAVGRWAARFLADAGARIVVVSDSRGAIAGTESLDLDALDALKAEGQSVAHASGRGIVQVLPDEVIGANCDILIPAARPDVIHEGNVDSVRARVVLQGANIPATQGAERALHERGVVVLPDFIANAGGVICAAIEYRGGSRHDAEAEIEERIARNTHVVISRARESGAPPRSTALAMATQSVRKAIALRR